MTKLSPRQCEIFDFIAAEVRANGISPSYDEIRTRTGLKSLSSVQKHVDILVARGLIRRLGKRARGIELAIIEHAADCQCESCMERQYIARLRLIEAIQVQAPGVLAGRLRDLRTLSHADRLHWQRGFPSSADSSASAALARGGY